MRAFDLLPVRQCDREWATCWMFIEAGRVTKDVMARCA
jgi:hypothetical protein